MSFFQLDQTLTLRRNGLSEQLSTSLQSTHCAAQVAQQLTRRLCGVRRWLLPQSRRTEISLLLLETEPRIRRPAHASYLATMQSTYLPVTPPQIEAVSVKPTFTLLFTMNPETI